MLDSNIVAVSLPSIARSLGATFTDIEWVVSAYVLTFAALLLAAGSYADRHGRKLATLIGLGVFTVASALCGLATSAVMLNLARALQGVGASLLLTASLAVINHAFAGPERAKAYAFWGACLGIAITGGPSGGDGTDRLPATMREILSKSLTLRGFINYEFAEQHYSAFLHEVGTSIADGRIRYREDIVNGLEKTPEAFIGMLEGRNFGKLIVRVDA
jgi:MFS family permease